MYVHLHQINGVFKTNNGNNWLSGGARTRLAVTSLSFNSKWNCFYGLKIKKKKVSDPWLQLYQSVTNNFIKPEVHFLFYLHPNTIRIVLYYQINCAIYFTYNWGSCTEIQLWVWQINCSNINPTRTACRLRAKRVKGTNLTVILRPISTGVTPGKSLLWAIEAFRYAQRL